MKDCDALAKLVERKNVEIEAATLITHGQDGTVAVAQTAGHRARKASIGAVVRVSRGLGGAAIVRSHGPSNSRHHKAD
jgi:hypothetical protein